MTRNRPYEKAMAFVGVAAGSMNAMDAATTGATIKYSGWTWMATA